MQVHTLCSNAVVVSCNDIDRLYSYDSLQAYHIHGETTVTAKPFVSRSTEKYIKLFCEYVGCSVPVIRLSADYFYEGIE